METEWIKDLENRPDKDAIERAGTILKNGGLVAFPTETVYGLGGDAFNPGSSRKIYAAKGRPSDNPLIVHICRLKDLEKVAAYIPQAAYVLAERFWPGPLTMIFKKQPALPKETTGGLDTVAVRFPDHEVALALIDAAGGFIAAPSANLSGRPSPTLGKYVYEDMAGRIDMLLDAGEVGIGLESTIVDLTGDVPCILRPGFITKEMLDSVLGSVELDPAMKNISQDTKQDGGPAPKAPGMKYKHYAPKGELYILSGDDKAVRERLLLELSAAKREGKKTGLLITSKMKSELEKDGGLNELADSIKAPPAGGESDEALAPLLFRFLREFDDEGTEVIFANAVDETGLGLAVMNRLGKAAGGKIINV